MQDSPLRRIYRLKTIIVAMLSFALGIALLVLSRLLDRSLAQSWLSLLPVGEIGGTLAAAGLFGIGWDYVDSKDKDAREDERIQRLLAASAPLFRDAVIAGFAETPEDLAAVATPEVLDKLAINALELRLGDAQLASELYAELRDQAIRAPERWHDVQVRVRLSPAGEKSATGALLFDVLVEWEYTVVPSHPVQRFACVSSREEFYELVSDTPATLTWFMTARDGLSASDQRHYELLTYAVNGAERKIRRTSRASGQTYSAAIGEDVVRAGKPVRIRQLYRTVTPQHGHRLYFEVGQPTRQFSLEMDYTDTDVAYMSVTDLVSSSHRSQLSQMPKQVDARVLGVDLPGWLLPKSGFAFVWTLASELPASSEGANATSA